MPDGMRIAFGFAIIGGALAIATSRIRMLVDLMMRARPDDTRGDKLGEKVWSHLTKVIGQKKLLQWSGPGLLHAFTFWGFLVIQVTLIESIGELFSRDFTLSIPWIIDRANGEPYTYEPGAFQEVLGFIQDFFFLAVVVALVGFTLIRIAHRPELEGKRSRFFGSHLGAAYVVLFLIFCVVWTVALARGARAALGTLPYDDWAFISKGIGYMLDTLGESTLHWIEDGALLLHLAIVFGFLILVVYSKHMHIFTSIFNVAFGRQPLALGALPSMEIDMENMDEDTVFGIGKAEDFTWKQVLDAYTCTECGRCSSVCPAWNTDKPLNPKFIITNTRDHLFDKAEYMLGKKIWDMNAPGADDPEHVMNKSLVGDVHDPDAIWGCTTCGACVYECPVDIEHLDHIVGMRRNQVMMESAFPQEAGLMLRNLESSGNPWGAAANQRLDWTKGMEDDIVVVNGRIPADVEYLYWVGCAGAFDDRGQKAVRAFAELMNRAGVGFAILGPQESCTGDPARRMGNEYLFQEMAKSNIELLESKGVRKIVASCPHCFNTMAKEYPQFGGNFEVIHHSELLSHLIDSGRLAPSKEMELNVAYHDPCYLARHNDVIEQPRHVVESVPGVTAQEAHRCKRKTFCCGAGGARMWMEETIGKRVNLERTEEMLESNPDMITTGCPYCTIMIDDGVKELAAKGKAREGLPVIDVAQLLNDSMPALQKAKPAAAESSD